MKLKIEKCKDYYIINKKYNIDKNGIIYFDNDYIGNRKTNYPLYLFEIAKLITNNFKKN